MTYITPSKALAHVDRLAAWKRGERPAPVTVEWDLSNRCHLGCEWCHFAHTHSRGPWVSKDRRLPMAFNSTGDLADISLVRRGLREMFEAGVRAVIWSGGGEPTVHPEWLDAVNAAALCGLEQGMYTAGSLLKMQQAKALASYAAWVVVSLDAVDRETYKSEKGVDGFMAACNAFRWMADTGAAAIGASFLLHAGNWRLAPEMLGLGRALGARYVTFRPIIDTLPDQPAVCVSDRKWIDDAMPMLYELQEEHDVEVDPERFASYRDWSGRSYRACHGIKLNATVTPDGRVWVCPQRRGVTGSQVGDLREESFAALWARHVGAWTDFDQCRVMCRLHHVNEALDEVFKPRAHEAFI